MENNPSTPLLGNRYQLLRALGKGGMADVYLSRDTVLNRLVAIKVLRPELSQSPGFREQFRKEALSVANLSHPNIVTVHDFGFDQNPLFIVMEYIAGTDLKTMIKDRGKFGQREALNLIIQACDGIGYAHRAGLVHCDIKPQNMLVSQDLRLKVTDFGIARAMATIHPEEQADVVWGSPQYFSPEQAAGKAPSPASDVYSLGVILYEMLTGELPFNSHDPAELARMHRELRPITPRNLNPNISKPLEQIILKVLSKEPTARYRTADQLGRILAALNQHPEGQPNVSTSQTPQPVAPLVNSQPIFQPAAQAGSLAHTAPEYQPRKERIPTPTSQMDWATIGLGLLALVMVGGLIPFWLYVWYQMTSIVP